MVAIQIRIREDQANFLKRLHGSMAEHIRRAVDEYIQKVNPISISASQSKAERRVDEKTES